MDGPEPQVARLQQAAPPEAQAVPPAAPPVASRRRWIKLAFSATLGLLLLAWALRNVVLGTPVGSYPVRIGDLTQTVVASGRVITPARVAIAAQVVGRVTRIAVKEGGEVVRGELLIELDGSDARAALAQADASVALASAQLRALREVELPAAEQNLREAQANLTQAERQLTRVRDLKTRGFVGQADLDSAQRNRDVAASQVGAARLQVITRQPDGSSAAMAQATLAQAHATLGQATAKLAQYQILASASGILISRDVESGDIVQPGQVLMRLASTGQTQIEVQLDEKNLGKLRIGQPALASADAYPNERFAATVSYINPGIDATRGAVEVKLDVSTAPMYLRQDMTVSVDIATAQRSAVLVIPTGAIHDINGSAPWVLVVRERRAVHQTITLGLLGDENAEVTSGLADGEQVLPLSAATVLAGAHVRARPST